MPLEISEIGVHVAVGPSVTPRGPSMPSGGGGGGGDLTPAQHEAIVNACVQQVMQNLRQMQER
ncbi:DUF5908 family protein [Sphingomonas sp. LB-2]|uniref:DUF5908 family protein n=1 Tax=Sphingomonas caeni TaxID=2984949 RepID=UPI002230A5CB|nr:DUF5908 family protein [Sphingomonas caeni]MCW3849030.1 DUF5908 family protein [Sphingomonas caeni]